MEKKDRTLKHEEQTSFEWGAWAASLGSLGSNFHHSSTVRIGETGTGKVHSNSTFRKIGSSEADTKFATEALWATSVSALWPQCEIPVGGTQGRSAVPRVGKEGFLGCLAQSPTQGRCSVNT